MASRRGPRPLGVARGIPAGRTCAGIACTANAGGSVFGAGLAAALGTAFLAGRTASSVATFSRSARQAGACHGARGARGASRSAASSSFREAGLTLYTARSKYPALNGWKLTIALEELREAGRIPEGFDVVELNLEAREHKEPWFLEINPNGRIPALVDHSRGGLAVFESNAMLLYLAETRGVGCLFPDAGDGRGGAAERYRVMQWLFFQASGIGPIQGQAHAFLRYVPEEVPYAQRRFVTETGRLYGVLDEALAAGGPFIAGDYSIADVALFPWVEYHAWAGQALDGLPALRRWREAIAERPAVQRGLAYNKKDINELLRNAEAVRQAVGSSTLDATSPSGPAASDARTDLRAG